MMMNSIVERLHQHALPDPHDEREVMHATLLREAAERIKELEAERDAERDNCVAIIAAYQEQLATLRQRIDDAPVVAWALNIGGVIDLNVSGRGTSLISKEDLQK